MSEAAEEAPPLLAERRGAVLVLTLNRPERLNAVSLPMYRALLAALTELEGDGSLRAAVLTGAGRAFCVGADLKAHAGPEPTRAERREYVLAAQRVNARIQGGPKPVIAAVNGHAIGGGLELALSCDLVAVAEGAKLRLPELAIGTFVGGGVSYTLERRVGYARARELLLLGDFVSGSRAAEIGLANAAAPAEEVLPLALGWAERAARLAPVPTARMRRLLADAPELGRATVLRREARALLEAMGTEDWREGVAAFAERREPRFHGR